jgi:secretion/DNA translocation related CpaE-like protein
MPAAIATPHRRPLVVTADPLLLDDLVRLAAAGGGEVDVAIDAASARSGWAQAPFVVVGEDAAAECAGAALPPRPGVILVTYESPEEPPFPLADAVGADRLALLPVAEPWLVDRFADESHGRSRRGRIVAILGGCGGAGASVLAGGLAMTARRKGLDTLLVDADPYGGGVDVVLGWERRTGLRWPQLIEARGRVNPSALVAALPGEGSLSVLSFDRSELAAVPAEAMSATLEAGRRGQDLVVVDLPRSFDEACLFALAEADRAYLVVPAELRACAAARRVAAEATAACASLALVVRDPSPGGLPPDEIAEALDIPLSATFRSEQRLHRTLESGGAPAANGRGPLAEVCRSLLDEIRPRRHRAAAQ